MICASPARTAVLARGREAQAMDGRKAPAEGCPVKIFEVWQLGYQLGYPMTARAASRNANRLSSR
jgi:hypothetical protein